MFPMKAVLKYIWSTRNLYLKSLIALIFIAASKFAQDKNHELTNYNELISQ